MLEISDKLKSSLVDTNQKLRVEYSIADDLDNVNFRKIIQAEFGEFIKLKKLTETALQQWLGNQVIVGVDGSVNTLGSNFPHYISLLQALAKSTARKDISNAELFCPLLSSTQEQINDFIQARKRQGIRVNEQEAASKIRSSKLAELELSVALKAIKNWASKLIILDGSLIRYRIEAENKWKELKEAAIKEEVLLVGVIEEIGTQEIGKHLAKINKGLEGINEENKDKLKTFYDRELLFGILKEGEMLEMEFKSGFKTAFLRSSRDPQVIGIDVLKEQQDSLQKMADLVYTLTPQNGRGIPLWLDIVDEEVRISDEMIENLIETYLDTDLKRKLFYSKRNERIY